MKFKNYFLTFLAFLFVFISCKKEKNNVEEINDPKSITKGAINFPDMNFTVDKSKIKIISGYNIGEISDVPYGRISSNTFYYKTNLNTSAIQLVVVLYDNKPIMQCISEPNSSNFEQNITVEEATEALVFMNPFLVTSIPEQARIVKQSIRTSVSFGLLVSQVSNSIANNSFDVSGVSYSKYENVVSEVLLRLSANFVSPTYDGITVNATQAANKLDFKIKNKRKRYLSIYADKYTSNNDTVTEDFGLMKSYEIELPSWSNIFDGGGNLWQYGINGTEINVESDLFTTNTLNINKLDINCYGLGIPTTSPSAYFTSKEFDRGLSPIAYTYFFDILVPSMEVITGYDISTDVGRGRPLSGSTALGRVINKIMLSFRDPAFIIDQTDALTQNNYKEFTKNYIEEVFNTVLSMEPNELSAFLTEFIGKKIENETLHLLAQNVIAYYKVYSLTESIMNASAGFISVLYSKPSTTFTYYPNGIQIPSNGLIAYYPFNGNANDESGNNNNGTVNGASLSNDRKGNANKAYSFDGINDYIQIPFNRNLLPNSDAKTYSFWFKFTPATTSDLFIQNGDADNSDGQFRIGINSSGIIHTQLHSYWGYGGGNYADYMGYSIPSFNANISHFLSIIVNNKEVKYYVDGVLVATRNWTLSYKPYDSNFNIEIGRHYNSFSGGYTSYFNGEIDELRIYNRALNENEIQALFNE